RMHRFGGAWGGVGLHRESPPIVTNRFVMPLLNSERIAQRRISNRCLWSASQRRTVITGGLDGRGSKQRIPKGDVGPETGGVRFLHPFQKRRRIAACGSQPLSQCQEQRNRPSAHGYCF